jgi:hypothetical protein
MHSMRTMKVFLLIVFNKWACPAEQTGGAYSGEVGGMKRQVEQRIAVCFQALGYGDHRSRVSVCRRQPHLIQDAEALKDALWINFKPC